MTRTDITTARSGSENPVGHEMAYSAPPADARILLIDDDPAMATMLTLLGCELSYTVDVATDGVQGLHMAREADVDLIVLGLEIGADDYVIKPFEVCELSARIGVHLRRQRRAGAQLLPSRLNFPGLVIDLGRHQVLRDGNRVALTPTEFNLLALLASRPGRVVARVELTKRVWGEGAELDPRSIDAHIYRLRRKIEPHHDHPTYLHAVPGVGYRFDHRPAVGAPGPESSSVCTETSPR
jgi:DNA-binding response OmpR family regulator